MIRIFRPLAYSVGLLIVLAVCRGIAQAQESRPPAESAPPQPAQQKMMSRQEVTEIIADVRKIVSPNGVEELLPVQIDNSTQWLSIRGRDRRNPILLFLHGGPGSPTMPVAYTFQSPWEDYFTVVQWDQRGTGKTYAANDPKTLASTMTVEQMTSDAEEVVRYLQKQFGKQKIFLLGHSWGTVLGVALAQRHPEWLYAYLGVGQMVNTEKAKKKVTSLRWHKPEPNTTPRPSASCWQLRPIRAGWENLLLTESECSASG